MNFSLTAKDLGKQTIKVVNYILGLNITPAEKRKRLAEQAKVNAEATSNASTPPATNQPLTLATASAGEVIK